MRQDSEVQVVGQCDHRAFFRCDLGRDSNWQRLCSLRRSPGLRCWFWPGGCSLWQLHFTGETGSCSQGVFDSLCLVEAARMQDVKEQHLANTLSAMGGTGNSSPVVFDSLYLAEATKVQDFNEAKAERGTYNPVMLFFLAAVIGVGHNFYWIAKPTGVIVLGGGFSITQIFLPHPPHAGCLEACAGGGVCRGGLRERQANQHHEGGLALPP